jgi:hypothetical protein
MTTDYSRIIQSNRRANFQATNGRYKATDSQRILSELPENAWPWLFNIANGCSVSDMVPS